MRTVILILLCAVFAAGGRVGHELVRAHFGFLHSPPDQSPRIRGATSEEVNDAELAQLPLDEATRQYTWPEFEAYLARQPDELLFAAVEKLDPGFWSQNRFRVILMKN